MKIFDLHAHLARNPITKEYEFDELINDMYINGIEKRVVSTLQGKSVKSQNDTIIEFVRKYPDKLIGCGVINPKEDDALEEVKRIASFKEIKIIEFNSLEHGYRPEKMQYILDPIFDYCTKNLLLIKVFTGHGFWTMPDQWAFYARRYQELTFIILHMGGSDFSYGTLELCKEIPNIVLEMSYETEMQPLKKALKEVDPEKLFYGSNYYHNFTDLSIMKFRAIDIEEAKKELLFYKNTKKLLKLE